MQYTALINASGLCVNALASSSGAMLVPQPGEVTIEITQAQFDSMPVGKQWTGAEFVGPVLTVTSRQGKHALADAGLYHPALAAIAALPEPARTKAQIDWEAATWQRNDPTLAAMAAALGLTEAQLDALFAQAATL